MSRHASSLVLALLVLAGQATAQCLHFRAGFDYASDGIPPGSRFQALAVHDDGTGSALYAGGIFGSLGGNAFTTNIARWTGEHWEALGNGAIWPADAYGVRALCSFDDGSGNALYTGGWYNPNGLQVPSCCARWNGTSWQFVGTAIGRIDAFCTFDDGSGTALYAFGLFRENDAWYPAARWTGASWSVLDDGSTFVSVDARCAAVFDDGSGAALYVGGVFKSDGTIHGVGKWNGSAWQAVGSSFSATGQLNLNSMLVHDDGSGPALYVAGHFATAGGGGANNIARWNGSSWSPLLSGTNGELSALASYDTGSGLELFVGGSFSTAGGQPTRGFARWSQGQWSPVLPGFTQTETGAGWVQSMVVHDMGAGPELFAGGYFAGAGGKAANGLAHGDGTLWSPLAGDGQGLSARARVLAVLDDGSGPALWGGGEFLCAGEAQVRRVARWNGTGWSSTLSDFAPPLPVRALAALQASGTREIYAGGGMDVNSTNLARLGPQGWSNVVPSPNNAVYALQTFDDGSGEKLFAGGVFNTAGLVYLGGIGRFDGANWSPLGSGVDGAVLALATYDDGSGERLYAAGTFSSAGGVPVNRIARWDGSGWSALGAGLFDHVLALAVFDDGTGPALYAGGAFTFAGTTLASHVARWDGTSWSALGAGVNGLVEALCVFDDGSGPALYAGGDFTSAGGVSAQHLAKWNGSSWSAVGAGTNGAVLALAAFDDGSGGGADLFLGGEFTSAGALPSSHVAVWEGCGAAPETFCFGDGSLTACPCANSGLPGHGCRNSATVRGAELTPSGTSVPDTLVLSVGFEPPTALSIFLQGDALIPAGVFFGDGLRCTGGNLKRLYAKNASGGSVAAPTGSEPSISQRSAALGDVIPPGATRFYQVYYRDPDASFCPAPAGNTWNVSNGARVRW